MPGSYYSEGSDFQRLADDDDPGIREFAAEYQHNRELLQQSAASKAVKLAMLSKALEKQNRQEAIAGLPSSLVPSPPTKASAASGVTLATDSYGLHHRSGIFKAGYGKDTIVTQEEALDIQNEATLHLVLRLRGGEDSNMAGPMNPLQSISQHLRNVLGQHGLMGINLNIDERLFIHDIKITHDWQEKLRRAMRENQTLKEMRFTFRFGVPNQDADRIIQNICQLIEQNHTLKWLNVSGSEIDDRGLEMLLSCLCTNRNLLNVVISDEIPLTVKSALVLINFIEKRRTLTEMIVDRRSVPCLITSQSDRKRSRYYHMMSVNGDLKLMLRSECLQYRLMDWCLEHDVPSAIDINSNKLILFITHEEDKILVSSFTERLKSVEPLFRSSYQVHLLDQKLELVLETNNKNHPGSSLEFVCANKEVNIATLGAILRDEVGNLYMLSTNHGEAFEKCTFAGKNVGRCVAEVYQYSPFIDGCLIEVEEDEVRVFCQAVLPSPMVQASLCGPYTGENDDIAAPYRYADDHQIDSQDNLPVAKCGESMPYACGRLVYYNFTYPMGRRGFLTDALLVFPEAGEHTFTAGGDSGAVIFRKYECKEAHCLTKSCHESLAMHYASLKNMERNVRPAIVHRLDTIIDYFNTKTGKHLELFKGEQVCVAANPRRGSAVQPHPVQTAHKRGRDLDGDWEHCKTS